MEKLNTFKTVLVINGKGDWNGLTLLQNTKTKQYYTADEYGTHKVTAAKAQKLINA